ncbi:MAG: carboxypeptidase-like regulatory domain-containing protein [Acidobacteriia bacterium]|nr:carboxypeptidase-like regulatory domain-containing protein [Terriglobia bacterium]
MLTKKALLVAVCCLVVFSVCPLLYGQASGSFSGTVSDKTGSVIAGASVKITSQGTGVSRDAKTDDSGHYLVPLLPVAFYTIHVDAQGFQPGDQKDLRLQVDEHREVNFTLVPASVTEKIEVSASEVVVETTTPTLGQVITSEQVAQLPLNGRNFVQLATLTPGTTQETSPSSFFNGGPSSEVSARGSFSLSVGGSRAQSTDWLLDGNDNNELTAGGISIVPSIDAIQEFKVLTYNYSAEYGTRSGPTVLVTTRSGSNQLHGSLFEFFRNTKLDARSYFAATREQFNLNQFGGSLGGPIQKDKTYFFVDYQAKMQRHGVPFVGLIPTPAMKNGDFTLDPFGAARGPNNPNGFGDITNLYTFSPFQCDGAGNPIPAGPGGAQAAGTDCNKIPANMIDPVGQAMMNLYPTSNANNAALGYNFTNVPVRKLNEGEFDVRVDHNFSSKDSVFARFSYDQAVSFVPGGSPGFAEQSAFASTQDITNHGRNVAVSETHVFSDRTINQFNAGFNRIFNHIRSFGDGTCESAVLGILGANLNSKCPGAPGGVSQSKTDCVSCGLSSTLMGNYWALGDRGFAPFQGGTNVFSIADSFDMIRGKHHIRVGGQVRAQQMNVLTNAFQDGFLIPFGITGDTTADLLMGQIGLGIHDQTLSGATTGRRWKMYRPYVQDDWRVTNNLTLNLGLAWALTTPITEAQNRQANFDFATGKLYVAGSSPAIAGCAICVHSDGRVGIEMDKTALEPRIGVAWKPFGRSNTAVRAGYAIFHDSSWNQGGQGLWENPPYFAESDNFNGVPSCPFGNATSANPIDCGIQRVFLPAITSPPNPATFPGTVFSQNLNFKQGRVQQFNLNVEHQLPGNIVLTVGYAGSRSHHILVDGLNLNVTSPSACPGGANAVPGYTLGCGLSPTTPPYQFGVISNQNDAGNARYDSLQIKAETKSARHGIYALIGYTYSRTFDSGFADGLGTFPGATYFPLPGTQQADWGLSQINLNHQFTASVLYDLPFGKGKQFGSNWSGPVNTILGNWEVDVIEKVTSGFPLFVVNSANASGVNFQWNGNSLNRPDQVGDPNKPGPVAANPGCKNPPTAVHTLDHWFNQCAFMAAAPGELGNANRAPLYGPRFVNTDFSVIKHFVLPYREGMMLDFRAEFFNIFNHAQFFMSGGGSGMQDINAASSFGVVNGTVNNPRVVQFALKLKF